MKIEKSLKLYQRVAEIKETADYTVNESWKIQVQPIRWK